MRMGNLLPYILITLSFCLTISCSSSKGTVQKVVERPIQEVLDSLNSKARPYDFFYGKARMKYNGTESRLGGRMTVMMKPDSMIWMNFKKLSIEGARVLMRPDSTWILYRLDDLYEADDTQAYLDFYNIQMNFDNLQDLIIGNYILPKEDDVTSYHQGQYYDIGFREDIGDILYRIDYNMNLVDMRINDDQGRTFAMRIGDFGEEGYGMRRDITVQDVDSTLSKITLKFSSIDFDKPRAIKFDIPNHYRKLP